MPKNQPLNQITQSLATNEELLAAIENIEFLSHLDHLIFTLLKELEIAK